jgi:hypothetical protein
VSSSIAMSGARRAVADAESLRLEQIELMFPDRDAHTDHLTCSYPSYRLVVLSLPTARKN